MNTHLVPYDGMACRACSEPLLLEPDGLLVNVICPNCGVVEQARTTSCRGASCGSRVFFGGKSGRVPIAVHTGASHFIDCVDAARFSRKPKPKASKPEGPKQAGLL